MYYIVFCLSYIVTYYRIILHGVCVVFLFVIIWYNTIYNIILLSIYIYILIYILFYAMYIDAILCFTYIYIYLLYRLYIILYYIILYYMILYYIHSLQPELLGQQHSSPLFFRWAGWRRRKRRMQNWSEWKKPWTRAPRRDGRQIPPEKSLRSSDDFPMIFLQWP